MHQAYTDVRVDGMFYTEYRIVPSVAITGTLTYLQNISTVALPATAADAALPAGTGNYFDQTSASSPRSSASAG